MTPLGPEDPIPGRPRRILVTGCSGAGKSTLARAISSRLGVPYRELDALYHGPGWVPRAEFVDDVRAFAAEDGWVCEWQYGLVRPILLARAELLVWLDLSRARVYSQLVRRTVVRRVRRVELWNGNREPPLSTVFTDPEHLLRWAWAAHARVTPRVQEVLRAGPPPVVVRLRSRRDVARWRSGPLAALAPTSPG